MRIVCRKEASKGPTLICVYIYNYIHLLIIPGKYSVPFFRQLWLVSGVKLTEMNSNFFSRYYYMSCAGLMAGTQYFC